MLFCVLIFFIPITPAICYPNAVRRLYLVLALLAGWLLANDLWADTFKLTTGETVEGELLATSANDQGVQIKVGDGQYQRVPWASFSQEDLKNFAKTPKMEPFVQPFIEVNPEEKIKKTQPDIKQPVRLARPVQQSLLGAMFSSSFGLFLLLVLYGANIYAGYEVARFRAQSIGLVAGLAAIPGLGLISPILFLSLPTRMQAAEPAVEEVAAEPHEAAAAAEAEVNPMHAEGAAHPTGLKLHAEPESAKSALPQTQVFQRGQYTFNRRFIETKFPGFFGVVRREADRDMVLIIKSTRGEYEGQRISRIAANDLHLQVQRGHASEEVLIPFQEIQEIKLKHKDA
jgi:hypothetical protein